MNGIESRCYQNEIQWDTNYIVSSFKSITTRHVNINMNNDGFIEHNSKQQGYIIH